MVEEVVAWLVRLVALRPSDGAGIVEMSSGRRGLGWLRQTGSMESCHRNVVERSRMETALAQVSGPAR